MTTNPGYQGPQRPEKPKFDRLPLDDKLPALFQAWERLNELIAYIAGIDQVRGHGPPQEE